MFKELCCLTVFLVVFVIHILATLDYYFLQESIEFSRLLQGLADSVETQFQDFRLESGGM